jgi:hypothetical protein
LACLNGGERCARPRHYALERRLLQPSA